MPVTKRKEAARSAAQPREAASNPDLESDSLRRSASADRESSARPQVGEKIKQVNAAEEDFELTGASVDGHQLPGTRMLCAMRPRHDQ